MSRSAGTLWRTAAALAVCLWTLGLLVLGALVAPVIFRGLPANEAADVMTVIFRRFDRVILGCAAVVLACEGAAAYLDRPVPRAGRVRGAVAILLSALGGWHALHVSPGIARLHASGAIRGLGEGGLALEALHRQATTLATAQLVLGIAYVALLFFHGARGGRGGV
ncbi:MAG: DUF4149 domain-containing protein [Myxococcales bacterium]|nr:DUF4149 domain-containing protein [Myxococcales bacterium]